MSNKIKPIYSDSDQVVSKHQKIIIIISTTILCLLLFGWFLVQNIQKAGRPSKNQYPVLGMMIDQDDGYQDFQVSQKYGVDFIYIKSTQGSGYSDDFLENNYSRLKGAQIPFGFYHYVSFDTSADSQFKNITSNLVMNRGSLPFVLKVTGYGKYKDDFPVQKARRITQELQEKLNAYYGDNCIIQLDNTSDSLTKYFDRLWIISRFKPKNNWIMWEYNNSGKVPGYAGGSYELSVLNGNEKTLSSLVQY